MTHTNFSTTDLAALEDFFIFSKVSEMKFGVLASTVGNHTISVVVRRTRKL